MESPVTLKFFALLGTLVFWLGVLLGIIAVVVSPDPTCVLLIFLSILLMPIGGVFHAYGTDDPSLRD